MTSPPTPQPAATVFPIARSIVWLAVVVVVLATIVSGVCMAMDKPLQSQLSALAAGLCLVGGVAGFLPVWLMSKSSPHGGAMGFLTGIMLRMALVGGVVLYLQWATDWPHAHRFSFWIAGWYLVVLMIEVKLVSSHVLTVAPGAAGQAGTTPPEPNPHAETL